MKCACIALLVFLFIVFGAGTPFVVYRNTGASETVPDTDSTGPVGNGTTTNSTATANSTTAMNGTTSTNGTSTTTNGTSLSRGPTRAECPQTDADALLLGDGTFICTYASGACTYESETGVLLDDQNGGSCSGRANAKDRARKSRRGARYEAIAKRFLA